MPLEDVVQGVEVKFTVTGADDVQATVDKLKGSLSEIGETADKVRGDGGVNGGGIEGLQEAFKNIGTTGAESFANIAKSVSEGNFTGLATLIGGPVAGSFVQAAESVGHFVEQQEQATIRNAALAKSLGTTPAALQALRGSFEDSGVSAQGFDRLMSRMARQISTDYPEMQRNIRTSDDSAAEAALRVREARQKLNDTYADNTPEKSAIKLTEANIKLREAQGIPASVFADQEKRLDREKAQLAVDDAEREAAKASTEQANKQEQARLDLNKAQEAEHERQLKDIPYVSSLLRGSGASADLADVSMRTLRQSIEHLAAPPGGGKAQPLDVLKEQMELVHKGTISAQQGMELFSETLSRLGASGGGRGLADAAQIFEKAKTEGGAAVDRAQANKGLLTSLGLAQNQHDNDVGDEYIKEMNKTMEVWHGLMSKVGTWAADKLVTPTLKQFEQLGEGVAKLAQGDYFGAAKALFGFPETATVGDVVHTALFGPTGTPGGTPPPAAPPGRETPHGTIIRYDPLTSEPVYAGAPAPTGLPPPPPPPPPKPFWPWQVQGETPGTPPPAAPAAPPRGFLQTLGDIGHAAYQGLTQNAGTPAAPAAAPVTAAAAPAAAPVINLQVVVNGQEVTATGASAPATQWGGGEIRIPGFEDGGIMAEVKDQATGFLTGKAMTGAANLGLKAMGIVAPAAVGTVAGVLSNPLHTGLLDATAVGAASRKPGDTSEEQEAKKYGATNLRDYQERRQRAMFGGMWSGGFIPGFVYGGGFDFGLGALEQEKDEETVALRQKELSEAHTPRGKRAAQQALAEAKYQLDIGRIRDKGAAVTPGSTGGHERGDAQRDQQAQAQRQRQKQEDERDAAAQTAKAAALQKKLLAGPINVGDLLWSGGIPGFATGSVRGPGTGTSDSILARLSAGEYVVKDAAVRTYGVNFMHAINNMQIPPPKYAMGGMVPTSSLPRLAQGGAIEGHSVLNLSIGGETFKGLKAPEHVASQLKTYAIGQQTAQTGRKPSWYGS